MKTFLLSIAAIGLAVSGVQACPYQKSVEAEQVDKTVVASVEIPQSKPVESTTIVRPAAQDVPAE